MVGSFFILSRFLTYVLLVVFSHDNIFAQTIYSLDFSDTSTYSIDCGKTQPAKWTVSNETCSLETALTPISTDSVYNKTVPVLVTINATGNISCTEFAAIEYLCNGVWYHLDSLAGCSLNSVQTFFYEVPCISNGDFSIRVIYNTNNNQNKLYLRNGDIEIGAIGSTLLPFNFLEFRAEYFSGKVELVWEVEHLPPEEFVYFIQKSTDNYFDFSEIGSKVSTTGPGHFRFELNYTGNSFSDSYFRIKAKNSAGKAFYSPIVSLHPFDKEASFSVFPNPADRFLNIKWQISKGEVTHLSIFDMQGREVFYKNLKNDYGEFEIRTGSWPAGKYFISIQNSGKQKTIPVIITQN